MHVCSFNHSLHNISRLCPILSGQEFMSPYDRLFNLFSLLRIKNFNYDNNNNNNNDDDNNNINNNINNNNNNNT